MRRLLTSYALYFNRRHSRSGHLFQNRYKSILCEEDAYLLELVRYIHLNPLRVGLAADLCALDNYPWSGHAVLMGHKSFMGQAVDEVLRLFGTRPLLARRAYSGFITDGLEMGRRDELVGRKTASVDQSGLTGSDPRILGGEEFREVLERQFTLAGRFELRVAVAEVVKRVCDHYGIEAGELAKRTRTSRIADVRSVICYLCVRELGHNGVEVGAAIGLKRAAVSRAAARGAVLVADDNELLNLVNR